MTVGEALMRWPYPVSRIHRQLEAAKVWHRIAPNWAPATSCREAALYRRRLGARSIPLRDELKTHLGSYDAGGRHRYVAVHCRAHQDRDDSKVAGILGVEATRLGPEELCAVFDMRYGLVNPFLLDGRTDVIQLFDCGVLSEYSPPHTMMTNAGDLLWGVEFRSAELVAYLSNARVEDVAVPPGGRG